MPISRVERTLLAITLVAVLYRIVKDEWPVGVEVDDA
jgi:hypothetical protein